MKVRRRLVGSVSQFSIWRTNGVETSRSVPSQTHIITKELLEVSGGHPYHLLSDPRRKPKAPKRYRGKDPQKRLNALHANQRYLKRLFDWKLGRSADIGGNFQTRKIIQSPALHHIVDVKNWGSGVTQTVDGVYMTSVAIAGSNITLNPSSGSQLDAFGARCIAKCLPTNPIVNMGQFLVELRDLPRFFNPFEWIEKAKKFRTLAEHGSSEYLNVAFGWKPFVEDINSFFKTSDRLTKIIQQYDRDSGRHIRRNAKLFDTSSTTSSDSGPGQGPFPTPSLIVATGHRITDVTLKQRVWFKGSFTYYLPPVDGSALSYFHRYSAYADKLFGLSLNPDLLWKVTPWTWALDWMANTGPIVRNWNAFHNQGLVMHYGYVMEEKIETTRRRLTGFKLNSNPTSSLEDYVFQISRVRRKATPYGFGLNPASFTPFQNGIIAALGINRSARWL
jgi:hypothetical protein